MKIVLCADAVNAVKPNKTVDVLIVVNVPPLRVVRFAKMLN